MNWQSFTTRHYSDPGLACALDYSRMAFADDFLPALEPRLQQAFAEMRDLEAGAIANADENRMVGHYWLRTPDLAPDPAIRAAIRATHARIQAFARAVHAGAIAGAGGPFTDLLIIGIGGSALGPQFIADALGRPGEDRLAVHFLDNTDPDGIDRALAPLRGRLDRTLVLVVSKSGGTPETRNGMLETAHAYLGAGVPFAAHAVAITGAGSSLDQQAVAEGWLDRFPMWDWVGGRTSVLATVGLLPAALQGIDIDALLAGAAAMDAATRQPVTTANPAAILAAMWYHATRGRGERAMVILPYKDRLQLFAKYLQQLIMESLGKERDRAGNVVHQGITVYGNKGSTDQHAYVQQLRDGVHNFFVTFIAVGRDREGASLEVAPGITSGDYLNAFLLGTRRALADNGRASMTLRIAELSPRSVGMLIALYERAVGLYAALIDVNAYHQPGVEAGKKAAAAFLELQQRIVARLAANPGTGFSAARLAADLACPEEAETVYLILEHLAANPSRGVVVKLTKKPFDSLFSLVQPAG
jgi:glucose-6-phosphate isomerase